MRKYALEECHVATEDFEYPIIPSKPRSRLEVPSQPCISTNILRMILACVLCSMLFVCQ